MQDDWCYNETYSIPVKDHRVQKTIQYSCEKLVVNAGLSFSAALGSTRKALSNTLHQKEMTPENLLRSHVKATSMRCQQEEVVLIDSDTSSFNFSTHKATTGLGPISDKENTKGFLVHSALALTTEGLPLGLLAQKAWVRKKSKLTPAEKRKRPYPEKESYKWLQTLRAVEKALSKKQRGIIIHDREADVHDFFDVHKTPSRNAIEAQSLR